MAGLDLCLLDSNILLRLSAKQDPLYPAIVRALHELSEAACVLCYTSQTLAEFWNVSTRPIDKNGFGLSIEEVHRQARSIETHFHFLPDSREVHEKWRSLLVQHQVQGVQVHDARLAASMYVHHVETILTCNGRDFRRYHGLKAMHPVD